MALFRLTEYARAEHTFVNDALLALARSRGGIVQSLRSEPLPRVGTTHVTLESGETVTFDPFAIETEMSLSRQDVLDTRVDALVETIDSAAGVYHGELSKQVFESMDVLTTATGNRVDATGKSIFDAMYEMMETVELHFEDDGSISRSLELHCAPDVAEKLAKAEAEITPDQQKQWNELIERKRQEFFARKRRRRLS